MATDAALAPEVISAPNPQNAFHAGAMGYQQQHSGTSTEKQENVEQKRRMWRMRAPTSWLVLVLVVVIIAAAVGGGVGGSLAVASARKSASCPRPSLNTSSSLTASTTTPAITTTTTSGNFVVPTDAQLPLGCDDGTKQSVAIDGQTFVFNVLCNTERAGGDLFGVISYSLHDCLMACAMFTYKIGSQCTGVVFGADLKTWVDSQGANCYLKNSSTATRSHMGLVAATVQ